MQTCFEVFGLSPDATQKELKRAYFSQVRLHPPEKDPENFQKIRSAYEEALIAVETDIPVFAKSDNPKERAIEEDIERFKSNPEEVLSICKNALQKYPKNAFFLYTQCHYLRQSNQGTNAIKSAEKLLRLSPDNRHYQMELALCYIRQGWTKKAQTLCDKIIAKGTRNADFLLGYITLLQQYRNYDKIYTILYNLISENTCQQKSHLESLSTACIELIKASAFLDDHDKQQAASELLVGFIEKNKSLLGKEPVYTFCERLRREMKYAPAEHKAVFQNAISALQPHTSGAKESASVNSMVGSFQLDTIMNDKRLPKCVHVLYRAYLMTPSIHPNAVKMDARLCGIKEREELLACKDILKKEYPDLYAKILPFLRAISTQAKADALKEELLEKYEEYDYDYFPDRKRYYYEMYPEEIPEWMQDDDDDDDDDDYDNDFYHFFFGDDDDDDDDYYDEDDDPFIDFLHELLRRRGMAF